MPQSSRTLEPPYTGVPGALDEIRAGLYWVYRSAK
jgi:hypothetical protein